jgi:phenylacetate-coenzyme A ligase PaaK-like adenylate-forming protein
VRAEHAERLHRLRDERLRALLRTAKAQSPWHAERLATVDVDAVTGADLAAIPTMTKTDVMEHWDEIVTDGRLTLELAEAHLERVASEGPAYLLGEYQVVTTGGSSGRRGVFVWDFEGWLGFGLARERPTFWLRRTLEANVRSGARSSPRPTRRIPRPSSRGPLPVRHSSAWGARSRPRCRSPRSWRG